jgi:hypothetical protein
VCLSLIAAATRSSIGGESGLFDLASAHVYLFASQAIVASALGGSASIAALSVGVGSGGKRYWAAAILFDRCQKEKRLRRRLRWLRFHAQVSADHP